MNTESPFTLNRFEYEREHLYFLPAETFPKLEEMKPTYLVGTRGTGKTTLLHALSWRERLFSPSLKQQIGNNAFTKEYIGVYLKLPGYLLARIDQWLTKCGASDRGSILGMYLDLIWLELVADALVELFLEKVFRADTAAEHDLIATILSLHPGIKNSFTNTSPFTMKQLANVMRHLRQEIESAARLEHDPKYLSQQFALGQVGDFGRSVAELLAHFCNRNCGKHNTSWFFKIAMDEAECLTPFQQRVLNTYVRLSQWPVSLVASYVRLPDDITTTLVQSLTLQQADRHLIVLDDLTDKEFKHLAEGVATVRIRTKLGSKTARFDAARLLGKLDIDGMIESVLKTSVNSKARDLLAKAHQKRSEPFFAVTPDDGDQTRRPQRIEKRRPVLYKVYLIDRLGLSIPSPGEEHWKRRKQDSAELRKKIVAAYLSICKEINAQVRYGSADMVLQMSDKCVRDFLAQMHEIFEEANLQLQTFLKKAKKAININKQDKALKRASKQKRDSIPKSGVDSAPEIGRLVDGLGQITTILQTSGPNYAHLRSPERGRFRLDTTKATGTSNSHLLNLVAEAAEAGFLRIVRREDPIWEFQVHCSLAAEYRFSYRGAYYPTPVSFDDLGEVCEHRDSDKRQAVIKQIGTRLSGEEQGADSSQMILL